MSLAEEVPDLRDRSFSTLFSHALRGVVAAYAPAHRRHGGEGAWYITLKRR